MQIRSEAMRQALRQAQRLPPRALLRRLHCTSNVRCSARADQEGAATWVPWRAPANFPIPFTQVVCLQLTLAYGSVGLWAGARGLQPDQLPSTEIAGVLLGSDILQLLAVLLVVRTLETGAAGSDRQQTQAQQSAPGAPPLSPPEQPTHAALSPAISPLRYVLDAPAAALGAAAAAAAAAALGVAALAQASGTPAAAAADPDLALLLQSSSPTGLAMLALSSVVVGPVTEEIVYRGLLLPAVASSTGSVPVALAVSSLAFAAYHLSWQDLPSLALLGLALGWAMERSRGNLLAPTLGHSLYNMLALGSAFWAVQSGSGAAVPGAQ